MNSTVHKSPAPTEHRTKAAAAAAATAAEAAASSVVQAVNNNKQSSPAAAAAAAATTKTTQRCNTTSTHTAPSSRFPNFSEMVYHLLCFRCKHGHCDVPPKEKPLGCWVEFVRSCYRKRKEDAVSAYLTTERIEVLNSIGFTWNSSWITLQQERNDKAWEAHYQNLLAFRKEHGHCNVPQTTPLGRFVKNQRHQYKQRQLQLTTKTPLPGVIPTERLKKLEAIGFVWSVQPTKVSWEERFQELVEFKKRFGHTNVVQGWKENVPLGRWVMKQRVYYHQRLRGEKHLMTDERMAKLNELGFLWVGQNYKGSSSPSRKRKAPPGNEAHPSSDRMHSSYGCHQQSNNMRQRSGSNDSLSFESSKEYGAL